MVRSIEHDELFDFDDDRVLIRLECLFGNDGLSTKSLEMQGALDHEPAGTPDAPNAR